MRNNRDEQFKEYKDRTVSSKSSGEIVLTGSLTGAHRVNLPKRILVHINKNPGIHYRAIWRNLEISKDTLSRNLKKLEEQNKIKIRREGYFKFFYPIGIKRIPFSLTPMQKKIFNIVEKDAGSTYNKIGKVLNRTPENILYHMKNLIKIGLVHSKKVDNQLHWFPAETDNNKK